MKVGFANTGFARNSSEKRQNSEDLGGIRKRSGILTLLIASVLPMLSACSHTEPGIRVVKVPTPVPVACVPLEDIPEEPPTVGHLLTGDKEKDFDIVAASALLLRAWGKEMHAALVACADED